jgi:DNA-binding transcriptional ArsR family regulator
MNPMDSFMTSPWRELDMLQIQERSGHVLTGAGQLREVGLVVVRAEGKQRLYALRPEPLAEVDQWLEPYCAFWSKRLDTLERHLEENP